MNFSKEIRECVPVQNNRIVLIIDDEPHILRVLEHAFKERGYHVLKAMDGEEGLNIIKERKPDVVITDIFMPKLDGRALCEQTNALKKEWPFLTVIITCKISACEEKWLCRLQDTVFMEKPFSPSRLLQRIERYFEVQT